MIDVIIPAYNAHNTIKNTLDSIASQKNIDQINVLIVNDASDNDYNNEVKKYSNVMNIKEVTLDTNRGPGVARQKGIDSSSSDYIMFVDSDDILCSDVSVSILYDAITSSNADVVISSFYSEEKLNSFKEIVSDYTWLHGKMYKRKFLKDNNIRFNNTYANEDNGFNQLISLCNANIIEIPDFTYVWCYNEDSITRRNNKKYGYRGLSGFIYNITWAIEEALKRGFDGEIISELSFNTLVSSYFYYLENIDEKDVDDVILKNCKRLKELYNSHAITDIKKRNRLYCEQYLFMESTLKGVDLIYSSISFNNFLEMIDKVN